MKMRDRVRHARQKKRMTLKQLEVATEFSTTTLWRYEHGKTQFSKEVVGQLFTAIDEFIPREEQPLNQPQI